MITEVQKYHFQVFYYHSHMLTGTVSKGVEIPNTSQTMALWSKYKSLIQLNNNQTMKDRLCYEHFLLLLSNFPIITNIENFTKLSLIYTDCATTNQLPIDFFMYITLFLNDLKWFLESVVNSSSKLNNLCFSDLQL